MNTYPLKMVDILEKKGFLKVDELRLFLCFYVVDFEVYSHKAGTKFTFEFIIKLSCHIL